MKHHVEGSRRSRTRGRMRIEWADGNMPVLALDPARRSARPSRSRGVRIAACLHVTQRDREPRAGLWRRAVRRCVACAPRTR